MNRKWNEEEINNWYDKLPWLRGFNFVCSTCLGTCDMFQNYHWNTHYQDMEKEIALAKTWGFNILRVFFPFDLYLLQKNSYLKHLDKFIALCKKYDFYLMPVIGNDCCVTKENFSLFKPGKQIADIGYHSGRKVSPHVVINGPGYNIYDEKEYADIFYEYASYLFNKYKDDKTILIWDLFNEPGNTNRKMMSSKIVENLFKIAREINVSQPLTAGCWSYENNVVTSEIELLSLSLSDIITYHCYYNDADCVKVTEYLKNKYHRPLLNTEWLHRVWKNTIQGLYPYFKKERVGSIHWGFVTGLCQHREPWGWLVAQYDGSQDWDMKIWQHDLVRPELLPYDFNEYQIIINNNKD